MEVQQKPEASTVVKKVIFCPKCATQHIDRGEWAEKVHHNHLCLKCAEVFDVGEYSFGVLGTSDEVDAAAKEAGFVFCHGCHCPHPPFESRAHGMPGTGESPHEDIAVVMEHHVVEIHQLVTLLRDPNRQGELMGAAFRVAATGRNVEELATLVRMRLDPMTVLMGAIMSQLVKQQSRYTEPTPEECLDLTNKKGKEPA